LEIIKFHVIYSYMNVVSLQKIINKLVLPKYDWIVSYEIDSFYYRPFENFRVVYYVDSPDITDKEDEVKKVEKLTENLFEVLGPVGTQVLRGVVFEYDEDRVKN